MIIHYECGDSEVEFSGFESKRIPNVTSIQRDGKDFTVVTADGRKRPIRGNCSVTIMGNSGEMLYRPDIHSAMQEGKLIVERNGKIYIA